MKAAWFEQFGKAQDVLKLGEQPDPQPGAGEVRVRLHTSAVNPSDVKKRTGSAPALLDNGLVIPHSDGAGVIDAVGAGVGRGRIGQRVWVYQAQHGRRFGTAAEYVCLPEDLAAPLPEPASMEEGACLGIPVMTAHRCVFADGPVDGQTLLVTGGAGRVGHYAIQWAAQSGARVIATASNPEDEATCREAGAVAVVNHREPGWGKEVVDANGGQKVDRVVEVDFGRNLPETLDAVRTGGCIATYASMGDPEPKLPFYRMMFMDLTLRLVLVYEMPRAAKQAAIDDIEKWLAAGKLQHRLAEVMPLSEIVRAHQRVESGEPRGCVVLRCDA